MEEFIRQAKAISDSTRARILKLLENGELCVCDIIDVLSLKQPTASKHLNVLKSAGLAESRKLGTWAYYSLAEKTRAHNKDFLTFVRSLLTDDDTVIADRGKLSKILKQKCKAKRRRT